MNESRELFLRLSGIDIADVATPHRLLRLAADEQNPQAVEQAAARLLDQLRAVADRIPAPHLDWMTQQVTQARNFMLLQCGQTRPPVFAPPPLHRRPPAVPSPPAPTPMHQPPTADPPIVVRPTVPRRRPGFDAENLLGIVGILVMLAVAGIGAKLFHDEWWKDAIRPVPPRPSNVTKADPPPSVKSGEGAKPQPKPDPAPPRPEPKPKPKPKPRGDRAKAFVHLKSALANVRKGFFDEADLDAQKALRAAPDCDEAEAMRLAVAYVRQYPKLADEALAALNENDVVDLGPKYGQAAFISRDDDGSIKFQVKGRPKAFTPAELAGISGARFRVAECFLDNANNPANDLILGACHFVKKLDADGHVDREGTAASDAARERWRKAEMAGAGQIGEQAGMLLKLLDMKLPD